MQQPWWKEAVIYQIYPRSFMDSDGDGMGDLRGICGKLDYLSDLGVSAVWLSPVYASPNADNGYDIADYQRIMEAFGSMEDWEALRDGCHVRGIRLVMDLVINHSSDEHPWFIESSSSRHGGKSDYYIWRDPVQGKEPNNWASAFGGSAWEYVPARGQYYLHLFSKKQPDLNWACSALREEIYSMVSWWTARGVDGFRVDAISYLDKPDGFPDSPEPPDAQGFSYCMGLLAGREKTHGYIRELSERVFIPGCMMSIGEVSAPTLEELGRYVRAGRHEFNMVIPFVPPVVEISTWSAAALRQTLEERYAALCADGWWAQFFSNHDKPRQVSLYGDDTTYWEQSAKLLATLLHTVPGTPFIYQGEEIGMTNMAFEHIEDYDDIDTLQFFRAQRAAGKSQQEALDLARQVSRDNARTPMQWDASPHAGFTVGEPWIGVNPNYKKINVAAQQTDRYSILSYYKRLLAMRRQCPWMVQGSFKLLNLGNPAQLIAFKRVWDKKEYWVLLNLSPRDCALAGALPERRAILFSSYERQGGYRGGAMRPYEAVVFEA